MKTSLKGVLALAAHEGVVPAPYLDSRGVWTYGVGHTAAAGPPDPAAMPKAFPHPAELSAAVDAALRVFIEDLPRYEARVRQALQVPVKQHEFDALVSFDFNTGGIHKAKLTQAINARDPSAADRFMGWVRPKEIVGRRRAEMALFRSGDYSGAIRSIPVWRTDGAGRLKGMLRSLDGREVLQRLEQVGLWQTHAQTPKPSGDAGFWSRPLRDTLEMWGLLK